MLAVTNLLLFESKKKNQIYPDANTGSFLKEGSKFYFAVGNLLTKICA